MSESGISAIKQVVFLVLAVELKENWSLLKAICKAFMPCSTTVISPHGGAVSRPCVALRRDSISTRNNEVLKRQTCDINVFVFLFSKSQDEDSQIMTEVDLFISTKAVKVLNADTQVSNSSN